MYIHKVVLIAGNRHSNWGVEPRLLDGYLESSNRLCAIGMKLGFKMLIIVKSYRYINITSCQ